jgi:VWFA-related protein
MRLFRHPWVISVLLWSTPVVTGRPVRSAGTTGNTARSDPELLTIHKKVEEVQVMFTVTDRHGKPVEGLAASDIVIWDDQEPVPAVTSFGHNSAVPLRLGLLVDASESMTRGFSQELEAAQAFLRSVLRPDLDQAVVASFAAKAQVSMGNDPVLLRTAMPQQGAAGQTALYDALCQVARSEILSGKEEHPVRRVMVLLSDGEDNYSRASLEDAIEAAQRREIAVYAISVHNRRLEYPGDRILRRLTEATGGRFFLINKYERAAEIFAALESEFRAQYVAAFRPVRTVGSGRYHALKLAVRGRSGLKVRAREGYYLGTD